MSIARGELQQLSYVEELTYGDTPPAPTMLELWHNTESLAPQRSPFRSARSLGDRQVADIRMGRKSGAGSITSELTYANFDDFLVAVLCSDNAFPTSPVVVGPITTVTFDANAGDDGGAIIDSGLGFGGYSAGEFVTTSGAGDAANNATWFIVTAAAGQLDVLPCFVGQAAMVDDLTPGESVTVTQAKRISNGVTERSYTVEALYDDITAYHVYRGGVVNSIGINVPANGMVTCDWNWLFKNYDEAITSLGTPVIPASYSPFDGLSGSYLEGGVASSLMTAITLNVNNNYQLTEALGSDEAGEAIPRKFAFDGNVTYYKDSDAISQKFYAETETMIQFTLTDDVGNFYTVTLPRVKYTSLAEGKGDDGPIMSRLGFESYRFEPTLFSMYIDKS